MTDANRENQQAALTSKDQLSLDGVLLPLPRYSMTIHSDGTWSPTETPDGAWMHASDVLARLALMSADETAVVLASGCHRSHPHEDMNAECRRIADYEEVLADHRRLVRELDVALNGAGAAQQASLCDILGQVKDRRWRLVRSGETE